MASSKPSKTAFGPADLKLLAAIRTQDAGLRALLCTLARHGVALRTRAPARAARWLDELSVHPFYKGGQFLFDLLEWEDFMLDGPAPELLDANAARVALDRVAAALRALAAGLEAPASEGVAIDPMASLRPRALPALEAGFYLYQDVVLGALDLITETGGVSA